MTLIDNKELEGIDLDKQAHIYALIAWNGKDFESAKQEAMNKTNEQLEQITSAGSSIEAAKKGILARKAAFKTDKKYKEVIKVLIEIHNKWVQDNAKKYDRDAKNDDIKKIDKRLYQHLPTALIGIEELAKDMMFLQPYLEAVGIHIGTMSKEEYGAFIPAPEVVSAYQEYVDFYKRSQGITDLTPESINKAIDSYQALKGSDEKAKERIVYMKDRAQLLANQAKQKNPEQFKEKEVELNQ